MHGAHHVAHRSTTYTMPRFQLWTGLALHPSLDFERRRRVADHHRSEALFLRRVFGNRTDAENEEKLDHRDSIGSPGAILGRTRYPREERACREGAWRRQEKPSRNNRQTRATRGHAQAAVISITFGRA